MGGVGADALRLFAELRHGLLLLLLKELERAFKGRSHLLPTRRTEFAALLDRPAEVGKLLLDGAEEGVHLGAVGRLQIGLLGLELLKRGFLQGLALGAPLFLPACLVGRPHFARPLLRLRQELAGAFLLLCQLPLGIVCGCRGCGVQLLHLRREVVAFGGEGGALRSVPCLRLRVQALLPASAEPPTEGCAHGEGCKKIKDDFHKKGGVEI